MSSRLPPGPRDWLMGIPNIRAAQADVMGYFRGLQKKYGDIVYQRFGPYRDYVLFHPDQIREVLVTRAKSFERMKYFRKVLAQWNNNSILITEGEAWRRGRRMVTPAFAPKRIPGYAQVMVDASWRKTDRWLETIRASGPLDLDASVAMTELTLEIIAKTLFDADVSAETADIGRAVEYLSEIAINELQSGFKLPDWLPTETKRRKRWAMKTLDDTVRRFIRDRRASGEDKGDLLSMLLLAVDEEGDGGRMTDEQARDESMTLLLAGHDTSAAGLTWTWYNIARYPHVAERLAHEVREVLGDRQATAADAPRLGYVERVVKESLRLYPPAIGVFTRQAIEDVEIGGYTIPKGSLVQIFSYVTQRDPRWFPEPDTFDADRFLPERTENLPQFAYFPFGGGPRVCVGNTFAMLEMTLVVATMIQRLTVELSPDQGEVVQLPHMSLRPKGGLKLRWGERK